MVNQPHHGVNQKTLMGENQDGFADDPKVSDEELAAVNLFKEINPEAATPEQVKEILKTSKTLLVQKKNWREKALQPKPAPQEIIKPAPAAEQPELAKLQGEVQRLNLSEEKRQFGYDHELSPSETNEVFAYAIGHNIKPSEALDKPFIKSGLESMRSQARAEGATPGPSGRSPVVEGKPFGEMSKDDKRKNFPKLVGALQKNKR